MVPGESLVQIPHRRPVDSSARHPVKQS